MNRGMLGLIIALLLLIIVVQFGAIVVLALSGSGMGAPWSKDAVVVIRIQDVIFDAKTFTDRIDLYRDRSDVKAFVFRVETPGGSVGASQELANAFARLRSEDSKLVVVSVGNIGASGGYYAASQADVIVANPGSLVGSIGVIMEHMEVSELIDRLGVKFESITSGEMKAAGSITRPMTARERQLIQGIIDDAYSQFRGTVLEARAPAIAAAHNLEDTDTVGIERALDAVADGRILTGAQAFDAGLVDQLGDLEDALRIVSDRLPGDEEPNVIWDNPEDPWSRFGEAWGLARSLARTGGSAGALRPPPGLWYIFR